MEVLTFSGETFFRTVKYKMARSLEQHPLHRLLNTMTRFRPCIDLHSGQVKQIVGGSLSEQSSDLKTNHISKHPSSYFADLYKANGLTGAHVIMLGPGNEEAAQNALQAWPYELQVGGGINDANAAQWIGKGAEKVDSFWINYGCPDSDFSSRSL